MGSRLLIEDVLLKQYNSKIMKVWKEIWPYHLKSLQPITLSQPSTPSPSRPSTRLSRISSKVASKVANRITVSLPSNKKKKAEQPVAVAVDVKCIAKLNTVDGFNSAIQPILKEQAGLFRPKIPEASTSKHIETSPTVPADPPHHPEASTSKHTETPPTAPEHPLHHPVKK